MILRDETPDDADAAHHMISAAFGQPDEARLVARLWADGDAVLGLVAEDRTGELVGRVLLSRMTAPFPALALAPVAVLPDRQGQGVGSALVREALSRAATGPWRAVFVLGDPGYYARFGFRTDLAADFASPYAGEHFMVVPLGGDLPAISGELGHAPAFAALG